MYIEDTIETSVENDRQYTLRLLESASSFAAAYRNPELGLGDILRGVILELGKYFDEAVTNLVEMAKALLQRGIDGIINKYLN